MAFPWTSLDFNVTSFWQQLKTNKEHRVFPGRGIIAKRRPGRGYKKFGDHWPRPRCRYLCK